MNNPDPFLWLSPLSRKRIWFGSLVISASLLLAMNWLDKALKTAAAPSGIISFEFAGNFERARQILLSWDAGAKVNAALSLGIDYLFLVAYALVLSMACVHIARILKIRFAFLAATGFWLARAQFIAAALDAIENYALIRLLLDSQQRLYPLIAWVCALIKFSVVGMGLVYILAGFFICCYIRRS